MNEIRKLVSETYRRTIQDGPYPTEFKRALRTHERIPAFFDNMVKEFSRPAMSKVPRATIEAATVDMTNLFVTMVHRQAEERLMTPIKKAMMKAQADRIKDMKKLGDALEKQGEENEKVTQDKAGNQISTATIVF